MSVHPLERLLQAARRRQAAILLAGFVPWAVPAAALAWRAGGPWAAGMALPATIAAVAAIAWLSARRLDMHWLQRRLDAAHPALEDSSGLLAGDPAELAPLARLQRDRVLQRLPAPEAAGVRATWPRAGLLASAAVAVVAMLAVLLWPSPQPSPVQRSGGGQAATAPGAPDALRLVDHRLAIEPPAYTGLPRRAGESLDARVPEGARLAWTLDFEPAPESAALEFVDGRRIPLRREGDAWRAEHQATLPGLYRIAVESALAWTDDALHRIDVIPDRPPSIRVDAPEQTLSLRAPGQRHWDLAFEASDDHGLHATAELHLTMTEGSGENIGFREDVRRIAGRGDRHARRFAHRLDLDALGLSQGDDLIVHFVVRDMRPGDAQSTRSASHILRWPPAEARDDGGFDGVLQRVLPAYFASQRQIIIDTEALIAERPRLVPAVFADRSDAIAVDQRLLRLRYGQFLGEESEGAPAPPAAGLAREDLPPPPVPLPTNDAEDEAEAWRGMVEAGAREAAKTAGTAAAGAAADARGAEDAHGHDHAGNPEVGPGESSQVSGIFGEAGDVLGEFGHTHDIPEAATLLDPRTRDLLRRALGEMWQSELALRQARPSDALPPANRALALVKEIQQADRIYLSRTGTALPPVDFSRRLAGDRDGIAPGRGPAPATTGQAEDAPAALWRALGGTPAMDAIDTAPLQAWLRDNPARADDPLALLAAVDRVQRDPACDDCRRELRALLWPLAAPPPAAPPPRAAADPVGRAYLDALHGEATE